MDFDSYWKQKLFQLKESAFEQLALDIFNYQAAHNPIYNEYIQYIGADAHSIDSIYHIPFLPIEFFKNFEIKTGKWQADFVFESSGTTSHTTSKHFVKDMDYYKKYTQYLFESVYGSPTNFHILALLPSYLDRTSSSLVCMVDHLIDKSKSAFSGFYMSNYDALFLQLQKAKKTNRKIMLLGVSFALLDFAEQYDINLEGHIVMETGGMKGRRKEMVREALHELLKKRLHVGAIHSEYGMTELFSQFYMTSDGLFKESATMKAVIRDMNDPRHVSKEIMEGGLNIIDLANFSTCAFIETKDIGRKRKSGLEILGRFDNSDIRGCNQMI